MSGSPFQLRKSVHINLTTGTHKELRMRLLDLGLSMQEVFDQLATRIVEGDEYLNNILEEIKYNKLNKTPTRKVNKADLDSIFEAIKTSNPLDS